MGNESFHGLKPINIDSMHSNIAKSVEKKNKKSKGLWDKTTKWVALQTEDVPQLKGCFGSRVVSFGSLRKTRTPKKFPSKP